MRGQTKANLHITKIMLMAAKETKKSNMTVNVTETDV